MSFIQAPVRVSLLVLSMVVLWSGCTINRDIMFRTGDDFDFAPLEEMVSQGYRIAPNDLLQFRLFSNKGQRLNQHDEPAGWGHLLGQARWAGRVA